MANTPPDSVLVGYDGSPDAKRALAWAGEFARTKDRPLRLILSTGDLHTRQVTELDQDWERTRVAELSKDAQETVTAVEHKDVGLETVEAGPAVALIMAASPSSVIVLGSRGRGRLSSAFVGSVTQHVTQHAPCPVVVVRVQSNPDEKRVVVGVDASAGSEPALEFAFDYADTYGAPLTAIHVLQSHTMGPGYANRVVDDRFAGEISRAKPVITEALSKHAEAHPTVALSEEIVVGSVGRVLADASEQAALLAVGATGRGAFKSLLLGSAGHAVLQHARCPVVIAR